MTAPRDANAYEEALEASGLEDVQPRYRQLLLRLKAHDTRGYDEAVARYRTDVEEAPDTDPLAAWLAYGAWLANRIEPGELFSVEENGRAETAAVPSPIGPLLVHLPEANNRRGFVLAMPVEPSPAQRETAALLCE